MICFQDRTFCISPNCKCGRKFTPAIQAAAEKWWGTSDAPIALGYLCGTDHLVTDDQQF